MPAELVGKVTASAPGAPDIGRFAQFTGRFIPAKKGRATQRTPANGVIIDSHPTPEIIAALQSSALAAQQTSPAI